MALASPVLLPPDSGISRNARGMYAQSAATSDMTARAELMMRNSLRLYSVGDEEVGAPAKTGLHTPAPGAPGAPKPEAARFPADIHPDRQQPKDTATVNVAAVQLASGDLLDPESVYSPAAASAGMTQAVLPQIDLQLPRMTAPAATGSTIPSPTSDIQLSSPHSSRNAPDQQAAETGAPATQPAIAIAIAEAPAKKDPRPQGKSAAAEVLQLCQRQGIPLKLPEQAMPPQGGRVPDYIPVSTVGLAMTSGMQAMTAASGLPPSSLTVTGPRPYQDMVLGATVDTLAMGPYATDVIAADVGLPMTQEVDPSLPVEQQLAAALAEKARLLSALQNVQSACARKDEQVLDMQQRNELLQQQYLQLQSMYQGLLDQLQREQQQWANDCSHLQGELRSKQNVEELTKLLTNQLRQEQRQKKNVMAQLQAETSARQQLQDQLGAARMQMQKLQSNAESLQWLQSTRNKLQNDLSMANAHLQMERQRTSDSNMQLQSVHAAKQQLEQEVAALRMQLQPRMQGAMDTTAGSVQPGAADVGRSGVAYSQGLYSYADTTNSDLQYQRINTTMGAGQMPGSPTSYMMQPAMSMPMGMQDPTSFSSMLAHQY